MESVYCAVRAGSLNKIAYASSLEGRRISLQQIFSPKIVPFINDVKKIWYKPDRPQMTI